MSIKVVYNNCYGNYSLSSRCLELYNQKRLLNNLSPIYNQCLIRRDDPFLIETIEELGSQANTSHSNLVIESIPKEYQDCYDIDEYDGKETINCNPENLVIHKLLTLDINSLSDHEAKEILIQLHSLLKSFH